MDRTIKELVDFCKRIKSTKELPTVKKTSHKKTGRDHKKSDKKGVRNSSLKGEVQALTTACCMDQTKVTVLKTITPSRIL